jgi:hypothetical protein
VAAGAGAAAVSAGGSSGGSKDGPAGSSGSSIKVVFLRKAQALAAELGLRFGREDPRFAFTDAAQLAADSGGCLNREGSVLLPHATTVSCSCVCVCGWDRVGCKDDRLLATSLQVRKEV